EAEIEPKLKINRRSAGRAFRILGHFWLAFLNSARGFENQKCKPEMSEDAESASGAAAIYFQFRFDFGFKDIEMLVNRAGGHAAKLAVNQSEVGKNGKKESEQNDADGVEPRVVHDSSLSLRRNLCSTRSIWP